MIISSCKSTGSRRVTGNIPTGLLRSHTRLLENGHSRSSNRNGFLVSVEIPYRESQNTISWEIGKFEREREPFVPAEEKGTHVKSYRDQCSIICHHYYYRQSARNPLVSCGERFVRCLRRQRKTSSIGENFHCDHEIRKETLIVGGRRELISPQDRILNYVLILGLGSLAFQRTT